MRQCDVEAGTHLYELQWGMLPSEQQGSNHRNREQWRSLAEEIAVSGYFRPERFGLFHY